MPAALEARVLTSVWDQIVFNDSTSPVGCALERCAGEWVKDLIGLPTEAHVSFVTGATMASFSCLAAAREKLLTRAGHNLSEKGLWGAPKVIDVDERISLSALRLSIDHRLPMADSLILATALMTGATLWTQDADFAGIGGVRYRAKPSEA